MNRTLKERPVLSMAQSCEEHGRTRLNPVAHGERNTHGNTVSGPCSVVGNFQHGNNQIETEVEPRPVPRTVPRSLFELPKFDDNA
jgi:hypothetical protein